MGVVFQEERKIKQGEVVAKLRRMQGIKQEALGKMCPSNFSQQKISELESQIVIEEPTLEELASALGVTVEFIKNFNDENAIYNILNNQNTYHDNAQDNSHIQHNHPNINYSDQKEVISLLKKIVEINNEKSEIIENLTKIVGDLAEEVKKMKG